MVYLIGGGGDLSSKTSEKLKEDGSIEEGFGLKYVTRYIHLDTYCIQFSDLYLS